MHLHLFYLILCRHFYEQEGPHPWKNHDAYYSPLEAFALLGPSIKKCFCVSGNRKTARGPAHDFQAFLRPDDIFDNVDDLVAALKTRTVTSSTRPEDLNFHRFFVLSKPYDVSNPRVHGVDFRHAIPTLFLRRLLCAHFRRRTTDEQVAFILKLRNYPHARSFVYEPAILDALCASPSDGPGNTNVGVTCHLADGSAFPLGPGPGAR